MMKKTLLFSALLLASSAFNAMADTAPVNAPAYKTFHVGKLDVTALLVKYNALPNDGKVLGVDVGPKAVAKVLADAGKPTDEIELSVDALLIKDGKKNILIDTGLGPSVKGMLIQSLAKAGHTPEQITDVLITHVHSDHIGGLVTADGKQAFPNAVVKISAPDWQWLQTMPEMANLVKIITPQVKTFTPGDKVLDGIQSVSLKGHTPGHVGYQITSGKARIYDIADSVHSSIVSLAKPEWAISFDNDRTEGIANRETLLKQLAADHELIFAPHFPFPGVGYIVSKGDHYIFQPAK